MLLREETYNAMMKKLRGKAVGDEIVRLLEAAAPQTLGAEEIHFRLEGRASRAQVGEALRELTIESRRVAVVRRGHDTKYTVRRDS